MKNRLSALVLLLLLVACIISPVSQAQQNTEPPQTHSKDVHLQQSESSKTNSEADLAKLKRLSYIQKILTQKLNERSHLGERIEAANEQDKTDLRKLADDLTNDIQQLRTTLENIAIGGVDTTPFVTRKAQENSNWRTDVTLIAQPVIDSLKELTEKPRKLKELNERIQQQQEELSLANTALSNLSTVIALSPENELQQSVERLQKLWQGRRNDAQSDIQIARFQIAELQGDKSMSQAIAASLKRFATGRGLTLLIAALVASFIYLGIRFLLRGYRATMADTMSSENRTRYRLAAYSVQALTFVLILIGIFVVFYQRGDVLLLGLLILLIVGLALSIRQLLPQYFSEARLLLNVGAMRESERVIYRDIPWRVESINMFTVLRNPELHGVLRIPLSELHDITSRPAGKSPWFPTSRGDIILLEGSQLFEVIEQNPDTVELKHKGGQHVSIPTAAFYSTFMINLSRGGTFGVTASFGIDYKHQTISLTRVPKILRDSVRECLANSDLNEFLKDVCVELKEANSSSIDYWVFVTCDSRAAKSYRKIERTIQSACIEACTRESLNIPFPHVSIIKPSS